MKIFITTLCGPEALKIANLPNFPEPYLTPYLTAKHRPYELVDSAEAADIIVFWAYFEESQLYLIPKLRADKIIQRYPEKCFVVNIEDRPIPFLPGVYPSIARKDFDYSRHRSGAYGIEMNPFIAEYALKNTGEPAYLAAFTGGVEGLACRQALITEPTLQTSCFFYATPINAFGHYNNATEKIKGQELYAQRMVNAKFSLCPRGYGPGTHRLFESMQMGRCPVILNDAWVPPEGPAWPDCSIRVAEKNIKNLHLILRENEPRWRELGQAARQEWEKWYGPDVLLYRTLQAIVNIYNLRTKDERHFRKNWKWLIWKHYCATNYEKSRRKFKRGVGKLRRYAGRISGSSNKTVDAGGRDATS